MKKKIILLLLAMVIAAGCTYDGESLQTWVADPHYTQYHEKLDDAERSYLEGDMSYSEYLERKKMIDEQYTKEIKERESIIHEGRSE